MGAIEVAAAALIVLAVVVCILTVVISAADAGRIAAERLQLRAEARDGHGAEGAPSGERVRDTHGRDSVRRPPTRRRG